jgi:DNA-binding NtrC family response regulator
MIKRLVVLQDESLVMSELTRAPRPVPLAAAATAAAHAAAPPSLEAPVAFGDVARAYHGLPGGGTAAAHAAPTAAESAVAVLDPPEGSATSLADVAKQAALRAERIAISETLQRVHWNRRKAAQQLGVSYKTLLNKIKECGISRK